MSTSLVFDDIFNPPQGGVTNALNAPKKNSYFNMADDSPHLGSTSEQSVMSFTGPKPRFTVLIKGLINTGKSTLFNALFSQNLSRTSMKRQTMCQVILTETDSGRVDGESVIYETVDAVNRRLYIDSETKKPIDKLPEVEVAITPVQNLFSRIEGTDFRFVETVGFDDPSTDPANRAWFTENTKWADVLLFITDKEKCMNTMTEHTLLRETIKDLSDVNTSLGKSIPLIVVINKIEEPDDTEVQEMVDQCKKIVRRILDEESCPEQPVEFVCISAITALVYRMFLSKGTFQGMEKKDITRLAEMELGREGKELAKDPNQHELLAAKIREGLKIRVDEKGDVAFLEEAAERGSSTATADATANTASISRCSTSTSYDTSSSWQKECGLSDFITLVQTMCFSGLNPLKILLSQLQMHVPLIKAQCQSHDARDAAEVKENDQAGSHVAIHAVKTQMTSILDIYESYHTCINNLLLSYQHNGTASYHIAQQPRVSKHSDASEDDDVSGEDISNERELSLVIQTMEATRNMCASLYRELWKRYCDLTFAHTHGPTPGSPTAAAAASGIEPTFTNVFGAFSRPAQSASEGAGSTAVPPFDFNSTSKSTSTSTSGLPTHPQFSYGFNGAGFAKSAATNTPFNFGQAPATGFAFAPAPASTPASASASAPAPAPVAPPFFSSASAYAYHYASASAATPDPAPSPSPPFGTASGNVLFGYGNPPRPVPPTSGDFTFGATAPPSSGNGVSFKNSVPPSKPFTFGCPSPSTSLDQTSASTTTDAAPSNDVNDDAALKKALATFCTFCPTPPEESNSDDEMKKAATSQPHDDPATLFSEALQLLSTHRNVYDAGLLGVTFLSPSSARALSAAALPAAVSPSSQFIQPKSKFADFDTSHDAINVSFESSQQQDGDDVAGDGDGDSDGDGWSQLAADTLVAALRGIWATAVALKSPKGYTAAVDSTAALFATCLQVGGAEDPSSNEAVKAGEGRPFNAASLLNGALKPLLDAMPEHFLTTYSTTGTDTDDKDDVERGFFFSSPISDRSGKNVDTGETSRASQAAAKDTAANNSAAAIKAATTALLNEEQNAVVPATARVILLRYLEEQLFDIFTARPSLSLQTKVDFCLLFVMKKVQVRLHLSGYTIALRELLLHRSPKIREALFFYLLPALHGPLPLCDETWAAGVSKSVMKMPFVLATGVAGKRLRESDGDSSCRNGSGSCDNVVNSGSSTSASTSASSSRSAYMTYVSQHPDLKSERLLVDLIEQQYQQE